MEKLNSYEKSTLSTLKRLYEANPNNLSEEGIRTIEKLQQRKDFHKSKISKILKTTKSYQVRIQGHDGHFSPSGYSKYNERFKFNYENNYPEDFNVYGLEQAKEHVVELKNSIYEGKKHYENETFEIIQEEVIIHLIEVI